MFKVGDKVRCIDTICIDTDGVSTQDYSIFGRTVTVNEILNDVFLVFEEYPNHSYFNFCFELVEDES